MSGDFLPYPLSEWDRVFRLPKVIFGWPDWRTPQPISQNKRATSPGQKSMVLSRDAERCELDVRFSDSSGASIEGAQIRIMMWRGRDLMNDATATLQVTHQGKFVCISRIDINPCGPHTNEKWRRFNCPATLIGSHCHFFEDNVKLGREGFDPVGNLPIARPLEASPSSLRDFLQTVEQLFNVDGLSGLPPPPAQESML